MLPDTDFKTATDTKPLPLAWGVAVLVFTVIYTVLGGRLLQGILSPWWFRTDACPSADIVCGQVAPVGLLLATPVLVVSGAVWIWKEAEDTDKTDGDS
jgi:hypothetical protein